jgi:hypothetical protein
MISFLGSGAFSYCSRILTVTIGSRPEGRRLQLQIKSQLRRFNDTSQRLDLYSSTRHEGSRPHQTKPPALSVSGCRRLSYFYLVLCLRVMSV